MWKYSDIFTHCGLVMPYVNIGSGNGLLPYQDITLTTVDLLSVRSSDINLRAISQKMFKIWTGKMSLKNNLVKLLWHLPGTNELMELAWMPCTQASQCCLHGVVHWLPPSLVQDCAISNADALEISQSYTQHLMLSHFCVPACSLRFQLRQDKGLIREELIDYTTVLVNVYSHARVIFSDYTG